jgi:hypothetical protein
LYTGIFVIQQVVGQIVLNVFYIFATLYAVYEWQFGGEGSGEKPVRRRINMVRCDFYYSIACD